MKRFLSTGKMFAYESSLANYPLDNLEVYFRKYIHSLKPFFSESQLQETQKSIENTLSQHGPEVFEALLHKNQNHKNHVDEAWFSSQSYSQRESLLESNFSMTFSYDRGFPSARDGCNAAGMFCSGLLEYRQLIKSQNLKPDIIGTNLVYDMSQYNYLFGVSRIPMKKSDKLATWKDSQHLVVFRNNSVFLVPAFDYNGQPLPSKTLEIMFRKVCESAQTEERVPVSMISLDQRDKSAELTQHLESLSEQNRKNLELINSAICTISIEDNVVQDPEELYNNIYSGTGKNRWLNKSMHAVFFANGTGGLSFEQSQSHGILFHKAIHDIYYKIFEQLKTKATLQPTIPEPVKLEFTYDEKFLKLFAESQTRVNDFLNKLTSSTRRFESYKRLSDVFKVIPPSSLMQLSFQLAWHKKFNEPLLAAEIVEQRNFYRGKWDFLRVCTPEIKHMCETLCSSSSQSQKLQALKEAINSHYSSAKEVIYGRGIDTPLWAVQKQAEEMGFELPVFKDPLWEQSKKFLLSTMFFGNSNVSFGQAPFEHKGLGSFYSFQDPFVTLTVTGSEQSLIPPKEWASLVMAAMKEIQDLVTQ